MNLAGLAAPPLSDHWFPGPASECSSLATTCAASTYISFPDLFVLRERAEAMHKEQGALLAATGCTDATGRTLCELFLERSRP